MFENTRCGEIWEEVRNPEELAFLIDWLIPAVVHLSGGQSTDVTRSPFLPGQYNFQDQPTVVNLLDVHLPSELSPIKLVREAGLSCESLLDMNGVLPPSLILQWKINWRKI